MTDAEEKRPRSIYVLVRSRCRAARLSMEIASQIVAAFHALNIHEVADLTAAASTVDAQQLKPKTERKETSTRPEAEEEFIRKAGVVTFKVVSQRVHRKLC